MKIHTPMVAVVACAAVLVGFHANSNSQTQGPQKKELGETTFLSCDIRPELGGDSDEHICVGLSGHGSITGMANRAASDCATVGGIIGRECDLSGAVAGCRGVLSAADGNLTFTYWYYSGTIECVTASCSEPMYTVISDTSSSLTRGAGPGLVASRM